MQIRIYRKWSYELACSQMESKIGGINPMKLVSHDKLQYKDDYENSLWQNVVVIEEEKPIHPDNVLSQLARELDLQNIKSLKDLIIKQLKINGEKIK